MRQSLHSWSLRFGAFLDVGAWDVFGFFGFEIWDFIFRPLGTATRNRMQAVRHIMVRGCKELCNCKTLITKRRPMKRLPGYDSRTSRAELTAYCSLGLVGTALVTAAVSDAIKFAAARDDIVTTLTMPGATDRVLASVNATNGLTNLIRLHGAHTLDPLLMRPACSVPEQVHPM